MKLAIRNYNMADSELTMFVSNLVQSMTRDATEFAIRGVDSAAITAFEDLGNDFEVFPTDDDELGKVKIAVTAKNSARTTTTTQIQLISGFFDQKWGLKSGQYTRLGIRNLLTMREAGFLKASRGVVTVANEYLSDLSPIGLTQTMIDNLDTMAQDFEDSLNAVNKANEDRDIKTRERISLGNDLYSYVKTYCRIGKLIWENVDEAKYDDYIIQKTIHHVLPKPQNLSLTPNLGGENPEIISNWESVEGATSYEVYFSQVATGAAAGEFTIVATVTNVTYTDVITLGFRYYYKIKAKSSTQSSDFSDVMFLDV